MRIELHEQLEWVRAVEAPRRLQWCPLHSLLQLLLVSVS